VDGDTIVVAPDSFVRLIGVDTPETVKPEHPVEPFGPEATAFTRQFLSGGAARLAFDRERVDRFGRFLAYVWVDERMLNEELLRAGVARWEPNFHYSGEMKRRFRQAQDEARRAGVGIWSSEPTRTKTKSHSRRHRETKLILRPIGYTAPLPRRRAFRAADVQRGHQREENYHGPG
jgi:micrococcal nuclease